MNETVQPQRAGVFDWPVRVYYEDTDAGGVVYHASYLRFMERGRTEWLRSLGFEQDQLRQNGVLFVLQYMQVQFVTPALFNDELVVKTRIADKHHASLAFQQSIWRGRDQKCCCRADATVVCLNAARWRPMRLPLQLVELLANGC